MDAGPKQGLGGASVLTTARWLGSAGLGVGGWGLGDWLEAEGDWVEAGGDWLEAGGDWASGLPLACWSTGPLLGHEPSFSPAGDTRAGAPWGPGAGAPLGPGAVLSELHSAPPSPAGTLGLTSASHCEDLCLAERCRMMLHCRVMTPRSHWGEQENTR